MIIVIIINIYLHIYVQIVKAGFLCKGITINKMSQSHGQTY